MMQTEKQQVANRNDYFNVRLPSWILGLHSTCDSIDSHNTSEIRTRLIQARHSYCAPFKGQFVTFSSPHLQHNLKETFPQQKVIGENLSGKTAP